MHLTTNISTTTSFISFYNITFTNDSRIVTYSCITWLSGHMATVSIRFQYSIIILLLSTKSTFSRILYIISQRNMDQVPCLFCFRVSVLLRAEPNSFPEVILSQRHPMQDSSIFHGKYSCLFKMCSISMSCTVKKECLAFTCGTKANRESFNNVHFPMKLSLDQMTHTSPMTVPVEPSHKPPNYLQGQSAEAWVSTTCLSNRRSEQVRLHRGHK